MNASELQRRIPGLKRAVGRYKNLTDTNWLTKVYKDKFVVEDGVVRLKRPGSAPTSNLDRLIKDSSGSASNSSAPVGPPAREGGSSSSRALPSNYSVPALVFRGAVEVPKRTREQMQEAKRKAEAEKEQKKQEKRSAWAEKEVQKQLKQLERMSRRAG